MTSSNSFELRLEVDGEVLGRVTGDRLMPQATAVATAPIPAGANAQAVIIREGGWSTYRGHVSIGGVLAGDVLPHRETKRQSLASLRGEYGETSIVYEDRGPGHARLEILVHVEADPEVETLYERLFDDLEELHVGLAQDILGRTTHGRGHSRTGASALRPHEEVQRLQRLVDEFQRALTVIGQQPSQALERSVRMGRYRPGDRIRPGSVGQILTAPGTQVSEGRIRGLGHVPALRTRLSTDLAEHRHIRSGLERLAARARGIAAHCRKSAEAFEPERARWGGYRGEGPTVFEDRFAPRIHALGQLAREAESTSLRARKLVHEFPFLRDAGRPRSRLEATPLFRNRAGYRRALAALRDIEAFSGALVSGDELRVRYRSLSTLYEYWCFVTVVATVSAHPATRPPHSMPALELVDDIYRPDLRPGQRFDFPLSGGGTVGVVYEPDIPPMKKARGGASRWGATLGTGTLRPDVWVEISIPGTPPTVMVLDAKSKQRWQTKFLFEVTDYRTRIVDAATNQQPVRQAWMLHRDPRSRARCNVPQYLLHGSGSRDHWLLGSAPLLPDKTEALARIVSRFMEVHVEA